MIGIRRANRFLRPGGASHSGATPAAAASNLLVVRYPSAIDTPPTLANEETPLSGLFYNYLALILEAIMAELGPLNAILENHPNLLRFLGSGFGVRLSAWQSNNKLDGGNEAGQLYGFIKIQRGFTGNGWNIVQTGSVNSVQGVLASNKKPVLFASVIGGGISAADMVASVAGGVRGEITSQTGILMQWAARGHPSGTTPGSVVHSFRQDVDLLICFLLEAF